MRIDWQAFLAGLERHVRANPWDAPGEDVPPADAPWRTFPPATDVEIEALERRFGVPFPPSYVSFLRATNGLSLASHPIWRFLPAGGVESFRKNHGEWVRTYATVDDPSVEREPPDERYFSYADEVRAFYHPKQLRHTILITGVGDSAVYLLNPQVVWPSGEWEAWFLANWNPGVERYRSFAEMIWELYGAQSGLTQEQFGPTPEDGFPTVYQDPPGKPNRKSVRLRISKPPRPLERIARDVRAGDLPTLRRAIKELARVETPEALELLGDVLANHPVDEVREHVALALGEARRADAVPILLAALDDQDKGVVAHALGAIGDGRAVEPLLRLLEQRDFLSFHVVASALAKLKEPRAAESIGRFLRSEDPREKYLADSAAGILLEFGEVGLSVLLDALETGNAAAKTRALWKAFLFPSAQVAAAVNRLAADPDEAVRSAARQVLQFLPATKGAKRG
jgi:hypothetical protein